jgi:hypothetical protein
MRKQAKTALAAILAIAPLAAVAGGAPDVRVGPFNFDNVPFHVALSEIIKGTGVSVVMRDDIPGTLSATGVAGKLDVIVGKMCGYSGAMCVFDNGVLMVSMGRPVDAAAPRAPEVVAPHGVAPAETEVVPPPEMAKPWGVISGTSLRDTLAGWSSRAGWALHWDAADDFVLLAQAEFDGDFDDAVSRLLVAVNVHGHNFHAETYTGNKVLRVFK